MEVWTIPGQSRKWTSCVLVSYCCVQLPNWAAYHSKNTLASEGQRSESSFTGCLWLRVSPGAAVLLGQGCSEQKVQPGLEAGRPSGSSSSGTLPTAGLLRGSHPQEKRPRQMPTSFIIWSHERQATMERNRVEWQKVHVPGGRLGTSFIKRACSVFVVVFKEVWGLLSWKNYKILFSTRIGNTHLLEWMSAMIWRNKTTP